MALHLLALFSFLLVSYIYVGEKKKKKREKKGEGGEAKKEG